jgi:hypothetical protein
MSIVSGNPHSAQSKGAKAKTPRSRKQGDSQQAAKRAADRGKLVAITATGPIHLSELVFEVAPVSVGLAFIQELALRAADPRAEVVSTRAKAVKGDVALAEWGSTRGLMSGWLLRRTPSQRVQFLNEVVSGEIQAIASVITSKSGQRRSDQEDVYVLSRHERQHKLISLGELATAGRCPSAVRHY